MTNLPKFDDSTGCMYWAGAVFVVSMVITTLGLIFGETFLGEYFKSSNSYGVTTLRGSFILFIIGIIIYLISRKKKNKR